MFVNISHHLEWTRFQNPPCPCLADFISSWNSALRKEHQNGFRVSLIPLQWLCVPADRYRGRARRQGLTHVPWPPTFFFKQGVTSFIYREKGFRTQIFKNSLFPGQWLDAHIPLLVPTFCGLPWRIANFLKALNGIDLKKAACSNSSYDSERCSLGGPFISSNGVGKFRLCLFWVSGGVW